MTRNKEANKKYVIDFKVDVGTDGMGVDDGPEKEFRLRRCNARLNETYEVRVDCYWRENINLQLFRTSTYAGNQYRKGRKTSEETRMDSCSSVSSK